MHSCFQVVSLNS